MISENYRYLFLSFLTLLLSFSLLFFILYILTFKIIEIKKFMINTGKVHIIAHIIAQAASWIVLFAVHYILVKMYYTRKKK